MEIIIWRFVLLMDLRVVITPIEMSILLGKTVPSTHDWKYEVYTTYKNGDDWGIVYYCFTHIIHV